MIDDLFDFTSLKASWTSIGQAKFSAFDENAAFKTMLDLTTNILNKELINVALKFRSQEVAKISKDAILTDEKLFLERLVKASTYFSPKITLVISEISKFTALKLLADENSEKTLATLISTLNTLNVKLALFNFDWKNFSIGEYTRTYLEAGNKYELTPRKNFTSKIEIPKEIVNQKLYQSLLNWRSSVSKKRNVPEHTVLSDVALLNIASKPPKTTDQLAAIKGVGIGNAVDLGGEIMPIVNAFLGASTLF
ncbi:HRDC domain-containing protein [Pedobacter agri]|uniref:HRDC domain-containing protein n=1 Tax=Pedobacter agri TaxID=454586 RepID=UPI00029A000F|nr:HRDC domain-containing protein [Pedobacter agri]